MKIQEQTQTQEQQEEILKELNGFYGSENFYKDFLGCVLTDGFKFFCDRLKCYWLFTDLTSVIMNEEKFKEEDFLLCFIEVKDKKAIVKVYRDYEENNEEFNKKNLVYSQKYEYTDFLLNEFSFYVVRNELNTYTFMLKNEY